MLVGGDGGYASGEADDVCAGSGIKGKAPEGACNN